MTTTVLERLTAKGVVLQGSGRVVFGRPKKIDVKAAKTVKTLKSEERLSVPEISIRTGLSVASVYRALRA